MAQLFRRIYPSFSILFFISYLSLLNPAFAQLTLEQCAIGVAKSFEGWYRAVLSKPTSDPMKWCPLWAAVCSYVYRNCATVATCDFTNYDLRITAPYDPSSPSSYSNFLRCDSCSVKVSVDPQLLFKYGVVVPTATGPGIAFDESPKDMLADDSSASSVTAAITALLVAGSIAGSVIAVKTSAVASGTTTTVKTGGGNGQSGIDAITLLLHFQSISTSGLLSISYPALYRFFTYSFAWANLIITPAAFKHAVRNIGADSSCLKEFGSLKPAVTADIYSATGMTTMGLRCNLDRATIGGLVYLTAIIGVAVMLAVFILISVLLHTLNAIFKSGKFQAQVEIWPSRASSMSLRLFTWALGSIATFATYQFVDPCSSVSLIVFAAVELALIILTLLIVSVFIIKTASAQGPEALYQSPDSEESRYSRKWGSLYGLLKPTLYWFFIPDYVWVLAKGMIVGLGQGSGLGQVCALIGVELIILLALLSKRPYSTFSVNAFYVFSTCKRLVTSASLLVFWGGFGIPTNIKRLIGIILMAVESTYTAALFAIFLLNSRARIAKWNTERKERRQASTNEAATATTTTTTSPLVPHMHYTDSDFSNSSPMQEKPN